MQHYVKTIMILMLLLSGCRKDDRMNLRIILSADVIKETTDKPDPSRAKFYCRYDWEGDGVWDTEFTEDTEIHHRYYAPGNYRIKAEFLTQNGAIQTDSLDVIVEQGYSKPNADFLTLPAEGHFLTEFTFDASLTRDDEDSLENLLFRWDLLDDGVFETDFQRDPTFHHTFLKQGLFAIKLIVKDPSEKIASTIHWVRVNNLDEEIIPVVEISPEFGSVVDTFCFDASATYHAGTPGKKLFFAWQFGYDYLPKPQADSAVVYRYFDHPGPVQIKLTVIDQFELMNTWEYELMVTTGNRPPTAFFETPSPYGNIQTQFYFRCWGSKDDHQGASELDQRWDFEGDGIWDTPYLKDMDITHQYSQSGTFNPILEVRDKEGLTDTFSSELLISPYNNPTGYLIDERDNKMYSTVKIGSNWWMSKNLDWRPDTVKMEMRMIRRCYDEDPALCDTYGSLYLMPYVIYYLESGRNVCPEGWHVPDVKEFQELATHVPDVNSRDAMMPGGEMDFNELYSGYGHYFYKTTFTGAIYDTVWLYDNLEVEGFAASRTFHGRQIMYIFNVTTKSPDAWFNWYHGETYYYPIRCIKD